MSKTPVVATVQQLGWALFEISMSSLTVKCKLLSFQELFDERRRGKTSVSSSGDNPNDNKVIG